MMTLGRKTSSRSNVGFTLIELLVVISIIGLLLGILLPSLAAAREAAQGVVCQTHLRSISQAQSAYYLERNGDLAGAPANTARDLLNDPRATSGSALEVFGDATQPFDWAGPLAFGGYLGDGSGTPKLRNDKFVLLNGSGGFEDPLNGGSGPFGMFHCPTQRILSAPFDGNARPQGTEEFPLTIAFSYVSSRDMLWSGGGRPRWAIDGFWGGSESGVYAYPGFNDLQLPGGSAYSPNISRLDQPSAKVYITDGTRFQRTDLRLIDHDVAANAGYGGAFSDPGPYNINNTRAFPAGLNAIGQDMTGISYRHGGAGQGAGGEDRTRNGNAGFFDGHVATLNIQEARKPDYWLPSGSRLSIRSIAPQLVKDYLNRLESARGRFVRIN